MAKTYTIGITGGSGSGKTFFISRLASCFMEGEVCLLSQDNYYKSKEHQFIDERGIENFDLPEAIDQDAFVVDIQKLKSGIPVNRLEYTFNNPAVIPKMLTYQPAPLLIVEGIFIFGFPEIEKELDLKVYIEAKDHIKLSRRILRDNVERGYDLNDVLYRYENHVMPVYESFIRPLRTTADLIIPNDKNFDRGLDILVESLRLKIK